MMKRRKLTEQVILAKASPEPNTGCWLWPFSDNGRGYGRIRFKGSLWQAHRLFYEIVKGTIPDGYELDHKCRVTFCVNPDHLEPVVHVENVRRGTTGAVNTARQRSKTHCPRGHEYSGANLRVNRNGSRRCKTCQLLLQRTRRPSNGSAKAIKAATEAMTKIIIAHHASKKATP